MRLGVYADLVYRRDGGTVSADRAFVQFVAALPPRVEELVVFGRLDPAPGRFPYELAGTRTRFVPLPHYPSVFDVGRLVRALGASARTFARELRTLDAVWLFGPAPVAVLFALVARRHRTPVALGVRQDYPRYVANRLPSRAWAWALAVAWMLELAYRLLARTAPTVTVGEALARRYRGGRAPVLSMALSLLPEREIVTLEEALSRSWKGPIRIISVGRLDPEKNPWLLPEVLARLRRRDERFRLAVVGTGPLADAVREHARALGVDDAVEWLGYVPNGPRLWDEYRRSHLFVHVSLTEGVPQVLFEAQGAGLPVVATDVGGVAAAVGASAILVPPRDPDAAADAVTRVVGDDELRIRLVADGLANARRETTEVQLDRVAEFLRTAIS